MADLNYPIEGKTYHEIAAYFLMSEQVVKDAIAAGAKTYQDVYDFKNGNQVAHTE